MIILGVGVNYTVIGAILKTKPTKVFMMSFYPNNNNPKKFFGFGHFWKIAGHKTDYEPQAPLLVVLICRFRRHFRKNASFVKIIFLK